MNIHIAIPPTSVINTEEQILANRLSGALNHIPCSVTKFCPYDTENNNSLAKDISLIQAIHLSKSGIQAAKIAERNRLPLILTCSGTDVYIDIFHPPLKDLILDLLKCASLIIVPFQHMKDFLQTRLGIINKIKIISPGLIKPNTQITYKKTDLGFKESDTIILLEGGILPVKNIEFAIKTFKQIKNEFDNLYLAIVNTPIKSDYKEKITNLIDYDKNIKLINRPPENHLLALYKTADLMINVSHTEGYNPFLLTAMQAGLPILASDIPGNQAFIKNEENHKNNGTGLLYLTSPGTSGFARIHENDDFLNKLRYMLSNKKFSYNMGQRAQKAVITNYTIEKELYLHLQAYKQTLTAY